MRQRLIPVIVIVQLVALLSVGCRPQPQATTPAEATPPPAPQQPEPRTTAPPAEVTESFPSQPVETRPVVGPTIDELNRQGVLTTIHFDFDKYDLDDADRAILRENANWLRANPAHYIVVEGHCDERGTIEYNLALGERRAKAVRDYLTSLGVTGDRLRIISYGEEQPADPRSNETAWAKNRRAQFLIES